MPTKPWPKTLKTKDSRPSTYDDLSVETQRIVVLGERVYFFLWCWDMESDSKQTSVLFRAPISFDAPAERLSAIDSEVVDIVADGDDLLVLENAVGREGFGVVHRLAGDFAKPKTSTKLKGGNVYKALGRGEHGALYAVGDVIQRFEGEAWKSIASPVSDTMNAVASNGTKTIAVGRGTVIELAKGKSDVLVRGSVGASELAGAHVGADGTLSIAGARGGALQGEGADLVNLSGDRETDFTDCASFKGALYWSAAGKGAGVHVQKGKKLTSIFDAEGCFALTASDDYLFAASEQGVLRYDGKAWKKLKTRYDNAKGVWALTPAKKE